MSRVRRPDSWWCKLRTGTVSYGPREIGPPAPAGGGGIQAGGGDPYGYTTETKTLNKNYKQNRGKTQRLQFLGRLFCHNDQESGTRRHGVHKMRGFNHPTWNTGDTGTAGKTFNNQQTLTERTGAFKVRIIGEEDETHLESN